MQEIKKNNLNSEKAEEQQTTTTNTEVQEIVKTIGFPDGNDPDSFLFGMMDRMFSN